jgi:hypothetical protein
MYTPVSFLGALPQICICTCPLPPTPPPLPADVFDFFGISSPETKDWAARKELCEKKILQSSRYQFQEFTGCLVEIK